MAAASWAGGARCLLLLLRAFCLSLPSLLLRHAAAAEAGQGRQGCSTSTLALNHTGGHEDLGSHSTGTGMMTHRQGFAPASTLDLSGNGTGGGGGLWWEALMMDDEYLMPAVGATISVVIGTALACWLLSKLLHGHPPQRSPHMSPQAQTLHQKKSSWTTSLPPLFTQSGQVKAANPSFFPSLDELQQLPATSNDELEQLDSDYSGGPASLLSKCRIGRINTQAQCPEKSGTHRPCLEDELDRLSLKDFDEECASSRSTPSADHSSVGSQASFWHSRPQPCPSPAQSSPGGWGSSVCPPRLHIFSGTVSTTMKLGAAASVWSEKYSLPSQALLGFHPSSSPASSSGFHSLSSSTSLGSCPGGIWSWREGRGGLQHHSKKHCHCHCHCCCHMLPSKEWNECQDSGADSVDSDREDVQCKGRKRRERGKRRKGRNWSVNALLLLVTVANLATLLCLLHVLYLPESPFKAAQSSSHQHRRETFG